MKVRSIEDGGEREALRFAYDPSQDTLTIEGIKFSGDLFRLWGMPDDRFYRFSTSDGVVRVESLQPCPECWAGLTRSGGPT